MSRKGVLDWHVFTYIMMIGGSLQKWTLRDMMFSMKEKVRARNIDLIVKFKNYRDKGLTYGEIKKILKKDKRQFVRWNDYIRRGVLETVDR